MEDAGSGPGARFRLREMTNKRDTAKDEAEQKKLIAEAKQMAEVHRRLNVLSEILWNHIFGAKTFAQIIVFLWNLNTFQNPKSKQGFSTKVKLPSKA